MEEKKRKGMEGMKMKMKMKMVRYLVASKDERGKRKKREIKVERKRGTEKEEYGSKDILEI